MQNNIDRHPTTGLLSFPPSWLVPSTLSFHIIHHPHTSFSPAYNMSITTSFTPMRHPPVCFTLLIAFCIENLCPYVFPTHYSPFPNLLFWVSVTGLVAPFTHLSQYTSSPVRYSCFSKKLRVELSEAFPSLTPDDLAALVPNKEDVVVIRMYCYKGESVLVYQVSHLSLLSFLPIIHLTNPTHLPFPASFLTGAEGTPILCAGEEDVPNSVPAMATPQPPSHLHNTPACHQRASWRRRPHVAGYCH